MQNVQKTNFIQDKIKQNRNKTKTKATKQKIMKTKQTDKTN